MNLTPDERSALESAIQKLKEAADAATTNVLRGVVGGIADDLQVLLD